MTSGCIRGRRVRSVACVVALSAIVLSASVQRGEAAGTERGVALAIVYDTSGSMANSVPDGSGKNRPKYLMATRALGVIVDRLRTYVTNAPANAPRRLQVGLFVFEQGVAREAIPFADFNPQRLRQQIKNLPPPGGGTPLGEALRMSWQKVIGSSLDRRHVIVITDGENTAGPDPEGVLRGLKEQASQQQAGVAVHFVAFDVDAKVFDGVKKLGATVLGASNEQQLNTQLEFILERKILLEDEEPPASSGAGTK
jgi:hypothetical protein